MLAKTSSSVFEHAERYVSMLNEKQMDVLRLIADARTNAEIAEALNLTLAGAKWNVSEILTKLGLDVREEAAAFYRWHTSPPHRTRRFVGGLLSWGAWKTGLATGVVAAVVVAGVALTIAFTSDESRPEINVPGAPFYAEATSGRTTSTFETNSVVRWWYGDTTHGRLEQSATQAKRRAVGGDEPTFSDGTRTTVFDGTNEWDGGLPMFMKLPIRGESQWHEEGAGVGPVPQPTVDEFVASFATRGAGTSASVVARTRVLGSDVAVVELTQSIADESGTHPAATARYWIDPLRMFVMRSELYFPGAAGPGSEATTITDAVTKLEYGPAQPPDRFVWVPPVGAVENVCATNMPPVTPPGVVPEGFVSIPESVVPAGWWSLPAGRVGGADGKCAQVSLTFNAPSTPAGDGPVPPPLPYIKVDENRVDVASMLPGDRSDTHTLANGESAYAWIDGEATVLAWVDSGIGFQIHSNARTVDELVTFANGMMKP